jgi:O-antigen/teichoic acid export membrane protein
MSTGRRRRTRDATALATGSALSGLLAYVFFAATTRALGAQAAGPVSVLWSYWTFAGAALTFPVQHWIARTVAAHGEGAVRSAARSLGVVTGTAAAVLTVLAWSVRESLFGRGDPWFPLMVGLVTLGSALVGVVRGGLAARGRLVALGCSLVAENTLRCLAVGGLLLTGVRSPTAFGLCLVAGHLVVVLWPSAMRYARVRGAAAASGPMAFLAGAGAAQLVAQSVLTGGPVVLALAGGGQGQVTTLFAALALFRAPYMLALGLVSALTAKVAALVVAGQDHRVRSLRRVLLPATAAAAGLAAVAGAWPGPELLGVVFGADVVLNRDQGALTASSCTLAIGNLVLVVLALAHDRAGSAARSWLAALAAAVVAYPALLSLSAPLRITACLLVAELVAFIALGLAGRRRPSSRRGAPRTRTAGPGGAAPAGRGPSTR